MIRRVNSKRAQILLQRHGSRSASMARWRTSHGPAPVPRRRRQRARRRNRRRDVPDVVHPRYRLPARTSSAQGARWNGAVRRPSRSISMYARLPDVQIDADADTFRFEPVGRDHPYSPRTTRPPSTRRISPVMNEARALARNTHRLGHFRCLTETADRMRPVPGVDQRLRIVDGARRCVD